MQGFLESRLEISIFRLTFATEMKNKQVMKKIIRAICAHPFRTIATIGMLALSIHWGYLGLAIFSVPMFALWDSVNF